MHVNVCVCGWVYFHTPALCNQRFSTQFVHVYAVRVQFVCACSCELCVPAEVNEAIAEVSRELALAGHVTHHLYRVGGACACVWVRACV